LQEKPIVVFIAVMREAKERELLWFISVTYRKGKGKERALVISYQSLKENTLLGFQ
jgi:hypothetical protein